MLPPQPSRLKKALVGECVESLVELLPLTEVSLNTSTNNRDSDVYKESEIDEKYCRRYNELFTEGLLHRRFVKVDWTLEYLENDINHYCPYDSKFSPQEWIEWFQDRRMLINETNIIDGDPDKISFVYDKLVSNGGLLLGRDLEEISLYSKHDLDLPDILFDKTPGFDHYGYLIVSEYGAFLTSCDVNVVPSRDYVLALLNRIAPNFSYLRDIYQTPVQLQSGLCTSKEYAESKFSASRKSKVKVEHKCLAELSKVQGKNCGSRRKKNIRNLKKKVKYMNDTKVQSGASTTSEEVVEEEVPNIDGLKKLLSSVGLSEGLTDKNIDLAITVGEKLLTQYFTISSEHKMMKIVMGLITICPFSFTVLTKNFLTKFVEDQCSNLDEITLSGFVDMMKTWSFNWDAFKKNKHLQSFLAFVSMLGSCVLCPSLAENFNPKLFGKFSEKITTFFFKNDMVEGLMSTLLYLSNALSVMINSGSLQGFITTEGDLVDLQNRYLKIVGVFDGFKRGDDIDYNRFEYLHDLEDLILEMQKVLPALLGQEANQVRVMLRELVAKRSQTYSLESNRGPRASPFTFELFSGTGISKTYLTKLFMSTILAANGLPHSSDYIYTLNDADKFYSGWKNYMTGVILDDMENTKPEYQELNLQNFLLKACNNQPHNLVAADLENKGVLFNRAACIGISTNCPHLNFSVKTDFPSASERRIHYKIEGMVREEYCSLNEDGTRSTMIDYSLIEEEKRLSINPDAWLFNVYKAEIQQTEKKFKDQFTKAVPRPFDDRWRWAIQEESIDTESLLRFLIEQSRKHAAIQRDVLLSNKILNGTLTCKCGLPDAVCTNCRQEKEAIVNKQKMKENKFYLRFLPRIDPTEYSRDLIDDDIADIISTINAFNIGSSDDDISLALSTPTTIQSGSQKKILYLKNVIEKMEHMKTREGKKEFGNMLIAIRLGKKGVSTLYSLIESWTDALMSKFIIAIIERIFKFFDPYLSDPEELIPAGYEGDLVGVYLHAQRKPVIAAGVADWFYNLCRCFKLDEEEKRITPFTDCLLEHETKRWNKRHKLSTKVDNSIANFISDTALKTSSLYKVLKVHTPDAFRDNIFPVSILGLFITTIVPNFFTRTFGDYVEAQSGRIVSDEENNSWFQHKMPIIRDPVPVSVRSTASELSNNIHNNIVFIRRTDYEEGNYSFCQGLMICNYLIMAPKHEMMNHLGHSVSFTRKPQVAYNQPGNAIFRGPIGEADMRIVPGHDFVIMKIPAAGPVRDITGYFPNEYYKTASTAKVFFKDRFGVLKTHYVKEMNFEYNIEFDPRFSERPPGYHCLGDNFSGLCGAPYIATGTTTSFIAGLHVAGNPESRHSVCASVLKSDIMPIVNDFLPKLTSQGGFCLKSYNNDLFKPDVHPKSPFVEGDDLKNIRVLGSIDQRSKVVSNIIKTKIADDVKEKFNHNHEWVDPPIKGPTGNDHRYPYKKFKEDYLKQGDGPPTAALHWAVNDYKKTIFDRFDKDKEKWKKEIAPLNEEETFSGRDGVRFINGLNMSTSTGKYLSGKKSDHADLVDGKWVPKDYIMDDFRERDSKLRAGYRSWEMLSAYPKIEPTSKEKAEDGRVRMFFGANISTQMLLRKYFLPLTRFFCTETEFTECAVGINPHSLSWKEVLSHLDKIGGKNYFAFDFKRFDMSVAPNVMFEALDILISICERSGNYTEEDTKALYGLKDELLNGVIDMNGDIIQLIGLLPSGVPLTSILGCIINSIYLRIAFYTIYKDQKVILNKGFQYWVKVCTFGDDSIGKVHKKLREFNVDNVVKILNAYSIWTTNSFKDARKVKYLKFDELEFLKRKFSRNSDFGTTVSLLSEKSIFKSLSSIQKPKHVTEEVVLGQNIDGALFEIKFYGRKKYEFYRRTLKEIAIAHEIDPYCNNLDVSYDEMVREWKDMYADQTANNWFSNFWPFWSGDTDQSGTEIYGPLIETAQADIRGTPLPDLHKLGAKNLVEKTPDNTEIGKPQPKGDANHWLNSGTRSQSGSHPAVEFLGPPAEQSLAFGSTVPGRTSDEKIELDDFFSRPVNIHTFTWGSTTTLETIEPWKLYMRNKRVANRLANYNLIKGNLKVKVLVNGNGFFYGRMIAAYSPFWTSDEINSNPINEQDVMTLSTLPRAFINPTLSEGFEMTLPFLWHFDYFSLPVGDPADIGTMFFKVINTLKHANADIATIPQTVTINVYAWMEDVELVGLTITNPSGLVAQSGKAPIPKEERRTVDKPVSQAATNVATAAAALKTIPLIRPYMTALETGAKCVSSAASALGYTKPRDVEEPKRYTPRVACNFATTNTTDTCQTLATDVKQGLSISTKELGLQGMDEMAISYIAGREAYWYKFTWSNTQVSGLLLSSIKVHPNALRTSGAKVYLSPVAGACIPFASWTGTLKYRFSIISSAYHRGRLAVVYDSHQITAAREDNVQFTQIVDISDNTDFTLEVSNHQALAYLDCHTTTTDKFSSGAQSSVFAIDNGVIGVYVVNELTTPSYNAAIDTDVEVNVFVSAGDDFRVANPSGGEREWSISAQSGKSPDTIDHSNPITTNADFEISSDLPVGQELIYMGERIDSFRAMVKRYQWYDTLHVGTSDSTTPRVYSWTRGMYPAYYGKVSGALHVTATALSINYNPTNIMTFIRPAYSGMKGGMRYKFLLLDLAGGNTIALMTCTRHEGQNAGSTTAVRAITNSSKYIYTDWTSKIGSGRGSNVTVSSTQPVLDVEVPFYSENKFIKGKRQNFSDGLMNVIPSYTIESTGSFYTHDLKVYLAAADDFNLFMFTGWPPMYRVPVPDLP